jgi:SAM-dependent methyltransferase
MAAEERNASEIVPPLPAADASSTEGRQPGSAGRRSSGAPPDWQLPPGVNRGLWDYLHDPAVARTYDDKLADCALLTIDQQFAERHFDRPGRLLDLGCGTGRLLLSFARRGYPVLGVDLSAEMLRVARAKADRAGLAVELLHANIVELDAMADRSFDYAACLFSTLGMVGGDAQRRRVVGQVHRLLKPGGKFVLHVHNRWFNFWDPGGREWLLRDVGGLFGGKERGDRVMPAHQGIAGLTLHLFTRRETVRLLTGSGLEIEEVRPVSLRPDGRLPWPWWFGWLRAYGYLVAARKPPHGRA